MIVVVMETDTRTCPFVNRQTDKRTQTDRQIHTQTQTHRAKKNKKSSEPSHSKYLILIFCSFFATVVATNLRTSFAEASQREGLRSIVGSKRGEGHMGCYIKEK